MQGVGGSLPELNGICSGLGHLQVLPQQLRLVIHMHGVTPVRLCLWCTLLVSKATSSSCCDRAQMFKACSYKGVWMPCVCCQVAGGLPLWPRLGQVMLAWFASCL